MTIDAAEEVLICGTIIPQYIYVNIEETTNTPSTKNEMKTVLGENFTTSTSYIDPTLDGKDYYIYWNDISRYIFREDGEWDYAAGGGFEVLIPDFNAVGQTFIVTIK